MSTDSVTTDFVVSGDGHIVEPPDLFRTRLPKHLRDRGFWEENGYHTYGNPWKEERFSSQETREAYQVRRRAKELGFEVVRGEAAAEPVMA